MISDRPPLHHRRPGGPRLAIRQGARQLAVILTSRWLVTLGGAISACLVLWFLGPLLVVGGFAPFESDEARLLGVLATMVMWGVLTQMAQLRERQAGEDMISALAGAGPTTLPAPILVPPAQTEPASLRTAPAIEDDAGDLDEPGAGEVRGLQRRLSEALTLYTSRCGRPSLRSLPWYLMIGTPGAGKTSALANAGLTFPLADILGQKPLQGFAGTRSCDWWFTTDAVLVDTAGRYTTQDSDARADGAAWLGLLDLLKFHRPEQPLNGVVVAVSLADLACQPLVERHIAADALNWRLTEIEARLGVRIPVYVVLTKADRLAGFSEFFADLPEEQRRQVWGVTFPAAADGAGPATWAAGFAAQFDRLTYTLERRLFQRLTREPDPQDRALVACFPQQLAALKPVLSEFLVQALQPAEGGRGALLRGVYITSAKREGPAIDRLAHELAGTFGIDHRLPEREAVTGPLFLTRLFKEVVFAETHLARGPASPDLLAARRHRLRRLAAGAGLALALGFAAVWGRAAWINHHLYTAFENDLGRAAALMPAGLGGGSVDRVADGDLEPVLPILTLLRSMPDGQGWASERTAAPPAGGLDQRDRLARMASDVYQRALRRLFYPRLVVRLETMLAVPPDQPGALAPDKLYEALRVYLMMDGEAFLDRYAVTRWFSTDWIDALPGPGREAERRQLADHLAALLEAGMPARSGSAPLVNEVRRRLAGYSLAARGYARAREAREVRELPGWHLVDHVGRGAGIVLANIGGRALGEPEPGLYTVDGARRGVLPAIAKAAAEMADDGWIMGLTMEPGAVAARAKQLRQSIAALYFDDYARHWRDYLKDLVVVTSGGVGPLLTTLETAGGDATPLPTVLGAVLAETRLAPATPAASDDPAFAAAAEPMAIFKPLQQLLVPGTGRSQVAFTAALDGIGELHDALEHWDIISRQPGLTSAAAKEAQHQLKRTADRVKSHAAALPAPVAGWFAALADAAWQACQADRSGP